VKDRRRVAKTEVVLVFGESRNDSERVAHLLVAANDRLTRLVRALPRPVSLTRAAGEAAVRTWTDQLRRAVHACEATGHEVIAVLVHRDAGGPDPLATVEEMLRKQLSEVPEGHPVVPVQAIEAWWLLFPGAVEAVRPRAWRGKLPSSPGKDHLRRKTRVKGTPDAEADSVTIAEIIRNHGLSPSGRSASYERFIGLARSIP